MTMLALFGLLAAPTFQPPERLQISTGTPITLPGYAAPAYGDLDGDGVFDLVLGCGEMELYFYKNQGTNRRPVFDQGVPIQSDKASNSIELISRSTPQIVDLDGDGIADIVQGSLHGTLYVYRGKGKVAFHAVETLRDANGREINAGTGSSVAAVDWNGDGVLDLLIFGSVRGKASPLRVRYGLGERRYGNEHPLAAAGQPFRFGKGSGEIFDASVTVADWDSDGTPDLILGNGDGGVTLYPGVRGTDGLELGAGQVLVEPLPENYRFEFVDRKALTFSNPRSGFAARPIVLDWNGDGKLDLLVGDHTLGELEGTGLSPSEMKAFQAFVDELNAKQTELLELHQEHLKQAMKTVGFQGEIGKADPEQLQAIQVELEKQIESDVHYQALVRETANMFDLYGLRYQPILQNAFTPTYGFLWIYLRK